MNFLAHDELLDLNETVLEELRLQTSMVHDTECATYLVRNRDKIMILVRNRAFESGADPVEIIAKMIRGLHLIHISGRGMPDPFLMVDTKIEGDI